METERYKLDEQLHLSESYRRVALLGENSTTVANPRLSVISNGRPVSGQNRDPSPVSKKPAPNGELNRYEEDKCFKNCEL